MEADMRLAKGYSRCECRPSVRAWRASAAGPRTASPTDPDRRSVALMAHWHDAGPRRARAHPAKERADANPGPLSPLPRSR
jgi:hypothetical protein